MESILATIIREHRQHEAWWYKIKGTSKEASRLSKDVNLSPDEAPEEHYLSTCLGLTMDELWEVLLDCGMARKRGSAYIIHKQKVDEFITRNALTDVMECGAKDKQLVLRIGVYSSSKSTKMDYSAKSQWKSKKKPPRPLRKELKNFRDDLHEFLVPKNTSKDTSPHQQIDSTPCPQTDSSPQSPSPSLLHPNPLLHTFLSQILQSPEAMDSPSFFKEGMTLETIESMFLETCNQACELDQRERKEKTQEAVSVAVEINVFDETTDPQEYPTLFAKNIGLTSDEDITPVLREIVKLSKRIKSVDLLKVLHLNDSRTSLVEVPRSAKQSGFKKQARRTRWVHRALECVRRYNRDELVDEGTNDNDNGMDDDEVAYTNDDAARWLITYLGDYFPQEFVKSAQALDMPIHQGKMDAEYTIAMWSDAGVGVAAQRIIMKYFLSYFGYKFTVPESSINKLAVHSVPPIVGTIEYMDNTLDYWYKDLGSLLTGQIAGEHRNQPAGFTYESVDFVIGADHGQGSFRAGVKVIYRNADRSIKATAIYGLGEIECAKDTGELLALAFLPRLNAALKRIIRYQRDENGNLVSDGTLRVYSQGANEADEAEGNADEAGEAEGNANEVSFYAILDPTEQPNVNATLVLNVPIRIFITGDLAFYATVLGKEGMDKAHCLWCKLKRSEWQLHGHDRGVKWTIEELKRVASSLNDGKPENGVKSYPQIDCVELERFIFPVLHVTLGLANRLLKHTIDYADKVVERTPQLLKDVRINQIVAEQKHEATKQEVADWGRRNGPTLANMYLAQGHLEEEMQVEGVLNDEEHDTAIENAASLKLEIVAFKKELSDLKKKKTELSQANTAAKAEVLVVEKELGHYSKPIRKGLEAILAKDWNIKRPSWHGGDILGNECRKLMAWARLIYNQMKAFLLEKLVEDGASERAKREVTKRCDIIAKCLLLFDGFLSILRTDHKDLTPGLIAKAREYAMKALAVWRILKLSVTPKSHASEYHASDQLEFLEGLADFCEDWVEQLHQLGLKNNRRTKGVRNRDRKYTLYSKWEQLSGNRDVQRIKGKVKVSRKRKLQHSRGAETAAALQMEKTFHREAALAQDNSQWTGENRLLEPEEVLRLDAEDMESSLLDSITPHDLSHHLD